MSKGAGIPSSDFGIRHSAFPSGVGDVFEEDEAEDDVLVLPRFARPTGSLRLAISASLRFRRVHVVAQLVGGEPELGLEAEVGGGVFAGWSGGFLAGHACYSDLGTTAKRALDHHFSLGHRIYHGNSGYSSLDFPESLESAHSRSHALPGIRPW